MEEHLIPIQKFKIKLLTQYGMLMRNGFRYCFVRLLNDSSSKTTIFNKQNYDRPIILQYSADLIKICPPTFDICNIFFLWLLSVISCKLLIFY